MALTNKERVTQALDQLVAGLRPFVEREMQAVHGANWLAVAEDGFPKVRFRGGINLGDVSNLLQILVNEWKRVFEKTLDRSVKTQVHALLQARHRWAHGEPWSFDDTYRALDAAAVLLEAVSAGPQFERVSQLRTELLRTKFDNERRNETRKVSAAPVEGVVSSGVWPWREVVEPHPDVASGRYQQAEFAADLWQVYSGKANSEYGDPVEFYRRTYLTDGLKQLLEGALRRLSGTGGDPVVELQTNFGGGKTHSMLALYHLFSGTPAANLPGVDVLLANAGCKEVPRGVRRAVVVGNRIPPGEPSKKNDGTVVRTLWGELAWQLGGKAGYEIVRRADETASNPGDQLRVLFEKFGPCLVLIDEWVAYARQLHDGSQLPAGTFDTHFTFAQALTESAKSVPNALVVVSIPASDAEVGGDWGKKALERLKNITSRLQSTWRPASPEEGFEIVRRRLFQPITDPAKFAMRDASVRAFIDMYRAQGSEFPGGCGERAYEERFKSAYPVHPELFDRLFNDWSSLDRFQRTRGVLRLMATVIHALWEREDRGVAILPAHVPIDDPRVQSELTRYLEDSWQPVISKDVDGSESLPLKLDKENSNFGRYSAARRVARTIYIGSAPTLRASNRGIDHRHVKLGCVQPGEAPGTFGDALRHLTSRATYLFADGERYWYSTQPTVNRLAEDRAAAYAQDPQKAFDEIKKRLSSAAKARGDFVGVHVCPAGSGDVPDVAEARLVILGPEHPFSGRAAQGKDGADTDANGKLRQCPARQTAQALFEKRGDTDRLFRNSLVFLAADATRCQELITAVNEWLAWESILNERDRLNLDPAQTRQVETNRDRAHDTINSRLAETYQWLLVPTQDEPTGPLGWTDYRLQGSEDLVVRASKKLVNEDRLRRKMAGRVLRQELDRVPLWQGNHILIRELERMFWSYVYLPRLKDETVLLEAISDGVSQLDWRTATFAVADRFDEATQRYVNLRAGEQTQVTATPHAVLVKPEVAAKQMDAELTAAAGAPTPGDTPSGLFGGGGVTGPSGVATGAGLPSNTAVGTAQSSAKKVRRFYGVASLDNVRLGKDVEQIYVEVLQHVASVKGAKLDLTLEIQVELPDGVDEPTMRTVLENCRTLKFRDYNFEET